jgi:uncharacterized membrane protein YgcG
MNTLLAALLMQYVVSVKAGLVNHVQGQTNMAEQSMARSGIVMRTALDGYAEILLTPGAFLRLGENSEAVLDTVELENVSLRILKGPAVIEVIDINKKYPIHVKTGNLKVDITQSGIYRFEDSSATVIEGKLQISPKLSYGKGWQVFFDQTYSARKVGKTPMNSLDFYSQARSEQVARANLSLASRVGPSFRNYDYWMFDPFLRMYTYLPHGNFRSPYGFRYYAAGYSAPSYDNRSSSSNNSSSNSGSTGSSSTNNNNTNTNNNNNTGSSSSGGGGASERTVGTPGGGQSTPAAYIESKNAPVPITQ